MAESVKRRLERARKAQEKSRDKVYAFAAHSNMIFSECLKRAPADVREAHAATDSKVVELEAEAIRTGKAWRGSIGQLTFYK